MKRKLLALLLTVAIVYCFSGCFVQELYENYKTEAVTMIVTEETIAKLEDFPNLLTADLSGSTCYDAMEAYKTAHPDVEVTYTIQVLDAFYSMDTTALDLSAMTAADLPQILDALPRLPKVTEVNLMKPDGTAALSLGELVTLTEAFPHIVFNYQFDFFGQTVDLYTEELEYVKVDMGDEAEGQLREMLTVMPKLSYIKLDRCGFTSPVLDAINKDFPETKVVWRVFYGKNNKFNALTDETVIRSSHHLSNDTVSEMNYLTDVVYMDIGHNETLTNVSFLAHMPKLKLLILSGSPVTDISPLTGLAELEFVELAFCGNLRDLTPLSTLTGMKYLNIGGTSSDDITCLMERPMERFVCMLTRIPQAQKDAYSEAYPDCIVVKRGVQPYGYGWRYIDDGYNFNDYYKTMRQIFHYDEESLLNGYAWDEATKNDPW